MTRRLPAAEVRERLLAAAAAFGPADLSPDPLEVVRLHRGRDDLEVAGIVAAGLAFGGVESIVASVRAALAPLGPRPAEGLEGIGDRDLRRALRGFRHRWLGGDDVAAALAAVRRVRRDRGSLEEAFAAGDPGGETIEGALDAFAAAVRAADPGWGRRGAAAFVPAPADGSACKRPLLFLRWMVRRDGVDPGPWSRVDRARLVIPLDVHVARAARRLGLLRRRTTDWRAALETTRALRRIDPADPVRFDYPICRAGILGVRGRPVPTSRGSPSPGP